jgi:hypothetical protein
MRRLITPIAAAALLTGCFFQPDNFDAEMTLNADGSYSFSYVGELKLLNLNEREFSPPKDQPFDPAKARCTRYTDGEGNVVNDAWYDSFGYNDAKPAVALSEPATRADSGAEAEAAVDESATRQRECTKEELARLESEEKERQASKQQEFEQQSGIVASIFGGAIPGNDEALAKFAANLSKYDGWQKVRYAGDSRFAVEYRVTGRFDNYFAFPVLPDGATQFPFFHIVPRADGAVELLSPAVGGENGSFIALMQLGAMSGGRGNNDLPDFGPINGRFTLRTSGNVRANNAPDGFVDEGGMKVMRWDLSEQRMGPRALIALSR